MLQKSQKEKQKNVQYCTFHILMLYMLCYVNVVIYVLYSYNLN